MGVRDRDMKGELEEEVRTEGALGRVCVVSGMGKWGCICSARFSDA